jgi:hypothetical protein
MWTEFVNSISDPEQRRFMPNYSEASDLPSIVAMLRENDATIPVTKERWLGIVNSVQSEVKVFQADVLRDIMKSLKGSKQQATDSLAPLKQKTDARDVTEDEDNDFGVLERASSLFRCDLPECRDLFGYSAIFGHRHFRHLKWVFVFRALQHLDEAGPVVKMILRALNLPEDTSLAAMEQLNSRFMCLCGHPKFQKPMTFDSLVCLVLF